jgi:DNA-binding response OmpR family regulator
VDRTILVIEKDVDIQELISIILTDQGFTVESMEYEQGALQRVLDLKPCAIILDIIQVTKEGTELCRLIRETKETMHIPIIVLSTHPKAATVKQICADEVVSKPFDIDELLAAVEKRVILNSFKATRV